MQNKYQKKNKIENKVQNYDHMIKLLVIGDTAVGKTNMITRYTQNIFKDSFVSTIGVDFKTKIIKVDSLSYKMLIWDTAGQQRFRNITQSYYKNTHGIILTYSIVDRTSYEHINQWIHQIQKEAPQKVIRILVGTKLDLNAQREVEENEGKEMAAKYNMQFIQISAKDNRNINKAFEILVEEINIKFKEEGDFVRAQTIGEFRLDHTIDCDGPQKSKCKC